MARAIILLMVVVMAAVPTEQAETPNGMCSTCTAVVAVAEQLAAVHNQTVADTVSGLCHYLPPRFSAECHKLLRLVTAPVIDLLEARFDPDTICHVLRIGCDKYPTCHLFPKRHSFDFHKASAELFLAGRYSSLPTFPDDPCKLPLIRELCNIMNFKNKHDPALDEDGDRFSVHTTLRGSSWRGRDCRDDNSDIYPGRRPVHGDDVVDSNCNGIHGVNPATNRSFEDELCGNSQPRGVFMLGDSGGAHAHLPEEWITPLLMKPELFINMSFVAENEGDWPHMSFSTGFVDSDWPIIHGPVDSIYKRMRARNLCNHRDYHNLAVNGGTSFSTVIQEKSIARHPHKDKPAIILWDEFGNDICSGDPKQMTTVAVMKKSLLKTLTFINGTVAAGSHFIAGGIADGRFLYKSMHNQLHPIGKLRGDVTYKEFYAYATCLDMVPCPGWLNGNKTTQDITLKRSQQLNHAISETIKAYKNKFKQLTLHYVPFPLQEIVKRFEAQGGKDWQLNEAFDGFHPSQYGHAMYAQVLWDIMLNEDPDVWGPVNPHNDRIKKLFGDQGGH